MSKICPNCLHPVRTGANYCGYCGSSLVPTPQDPAPTSRSFVKASQASKKNAKAGRPPKSGKPGKYWVRVPITMLVVIILAALAIRYWPQILVLLGQLVVLLKLT
jgi:hypothetical protein